MKLWIGFSTLLAMVVVAGLGIIIFRNLNSEITALQLEGELALRGRDVATAQACIACHTLDGSPGIGPTWLGMYGKTEVLVDGSTVLVNDDYIRESIMDPAAKQVEGYENLMIRYYLNENDMEAILEFTRQLGKSASE